MAIRIPEEIRILARTYKVEFVTNLLTDKDCAGEISYREQSLRLQPSCEGVPRHREMIEVSFFHELIHGCLYELSYHDLQKDEEFVDRVANVLYAALRDSGMLVFEDRIAIGFPE